jgi:AraC family transcriptional regulator, regulatory protein of adaptative response / DNA-3-methyladenine glycosylase II
MSRCHTPLVPHHTDADACYAAVASRDRRFDGRFVTGVLTTGIYCRPSCPARTPLRRNVRFFATAAAAQAAGLRACRRCRPELAPTAPDVDPTAALASRALRLLLAGGGADGVESLARRLHVSPRHLHRVLVDAYGAGPAALARMHRVALARLLVEQTPLPLTRVAHAAGFGSVRQFNDAFRTAFGVPPSAVRRQPAATAADRAATTLSLPVRAPFDGPGVLRWAALHAVASRDEVAGGVWRRTTDAGVVAMRPRADALDLEVAAGDLAALPGMVAAARRAFDLEADVAAVRAALGGDPLLGPLLARRPGVRLPVAPDPFEGAVRVVVGQQVSARGATTLMGRLAALADGPGLPPPDVLAAAPLEAVGLTAGRARAVRALAAAVAEGLDLCAGEPAATRDALLALPGIGPWTAACTALLVAGDPDAWPTGDLALRRAVERLTGRATTPAALDALASRWRPWRGYAAVLLWHDHLDAAAARPR